MPIGIKGFQKGHPSFMTEKAKEKAKERMRGNTHGFKKGHIPWNKGTKNLMPIPWNKGKKMKKPAWNKGKKLGFIPKRVFKKGDIPWNKNLKGIHLSPQSEFKKADKRIIGKNNCNWRGGRILFINGYILIRKPSHPYSNKNGYIFEHRLIMEKHIKRLLKPQERVHHINGIANDNRIENLMLFANQRKHIRFEHSLRK